MRKLTLIKAPCNLGLKEPQPGEEPGVKYFADTLLTTDFIQKTGSPAVLEVLSSSYSMDVDPLSGIRNADAIVAYNQQLAAALSPMIGDGQFSLVIGGDCSILLGCALALKQKGNYGLFYLDGHTDYMLPHQSGTAGAAGMDLALITGNGPEKLSNMQGRSPYIQEEHVFCAGNRDYTDWYVDLIERSDIHYYDLNRIRTATIPVMINSFLQMIDSCSLDGFWIHMDVDVLNDDIMPCVDSRNEDGLWYDEMQSILQPLLRSGKCYGLNITIFDPTLDDNGRYINSFREQLLKALLSAGIGAT